MSWYRPHPEASRQIRVGLFNDTSKAVGVVRPADTRNKESKTTNSHIFCDVIARIQLHSTLEPIDVAVLTVQFTGNAKTQQNETQDAASLTRRKETRNSAIADKPRDAFVQLQWLG